MTYNRAFSLVRRLCSDEGYPKRIYVYVHRTFLAQLPLIFQNPFLPLHPERGRPPSPRENEDKEPFCRNAICHVAVRRSFLCSWFNLAWRFLRHRSPWWATRKNEMNFSSETLRGPRGSYGKKLIEKRIKNSERARIIFFFQTSLSIPEKRSKHLNFPQRLIWKQVARVDQSLINVRL